MIPYIACKVFHHTGMTVSQTFKAVLQSEKFQFAPILQDRTKILSLVAGWLAKTGIDATSVQRMYMARNSQQAREAYSIAIVLSGSKFIIVFIGITICVGYNNITHARMIWPL